MLKETADRHFSLGDLARIVFAGSGVMACTLLACSFFGPLRLGLGAGSVFWRWEIWSHPIWQARVMRLLATGLAGGGLAVAGAGIQGLLRNPLADPYILGLSSGAALGVRVGTLLVAVTGALPVWFASHLLTPALAFSGALLTCLVVYMLACQQGQVDPRSIILAGIIVNTFNAALAMGLTLFMDVYRVDQFTRWSLGEIPDVVDRTLLVASALLVMVASFWLMTRGKALNVLGFGEDVAASSGVSVRRLRAGVFLAVSLLTAACVALAGPLSFVGLIIPHICRMLTGPDHRRLLPSAFFTGGTLLMLADTVCRTVGPAIQLGRIPVGIATALAGGPFFIMLMRRQARGGARL